MFPSKIAAISGISTTNDRYLNFGGTNEYIEVANQANFDFERTDAFSISAWIKTSSTNNQGIFGKSNISSGNWTGYTFFLGDPGSSPGHLYFQMVGTSSSNNIDMRTTSATVSDGSWHHVVITKGTGSNVAAVTIYKDTVASAITTISDDLSTDTSNTQKPLIGAVDSRVASSTGGYPFIGGIDEVAVFTKELSVSEIFILYGNGMPQTAGNANSISNLLGYWRMEEGTGTSVVDSSANSNTGTMKNMESAEDWISY